MNFDASTLPNMTSVYIPSAGIFPPPKAFPESKVQIFVGDGFAAEDVDKLTQSHIRGVLNVAYDLDDQPPGDEYKQELLADPNRPSPNVPQEAKLAKLQRYKQQFAKVGLIDGYGNITNHMAVIAAVYMAEQLFNFPPGGDNVCPPLVNDYERGNLLIHCWSGRSRSVTVAALYIWYKFGVELKDPKLSSFSQVYDEVKRRRGDSLDPISDQSKMICNSSNSTGFTETPPTCGMQEAAFTIVDTYATLFPAITLN